MTPPPESTAPVPSAITREADGRLASLAFHSVPPPAMSGIDLWLVAVDDSDSALRAVALAAQQASTMPTHALHLVNVQPWLSKEAAELELAQRAWQATAKARAALDTAGIAWHLHVVMGDASAGILSMATQLGCTGIYVGSRGVSITNSILLGSVAYKVLHLSPLPVLVVP